MSYEKFKGNKYKVVDLKKGKVLLLTLDITYI
ncbi:hypothetical protein SAMN04487886_11246 [Clostridium sp. DSM 8431]|nr:hypothetical protein SAMN04487886_11246 [Clostridium sp. DSM 8431]